MQVLLRQSLLQLWLGWSGILQIFQYGHEVITQKAKDNRLLQHEKLVYESSICWEHIKTNESYDFIEGCQLSYWEFTIVSV